MRDAKTALILLTMVMGVLIDGIDGSMVEVIVPTIAEEFGSSIGEASWIIIAYTMVVAALLLPFTKIADAGNIRTVYIVGAIVFGIGTLLGGLSTSMPMMIAARLVHGLGAAIIMSTAAMICVKFMPRAKLGLALAIMVVSTALGWSIGPAIGGIVAEATSWHWVFFMNIPLSMIALFFGLRYLPKEERRPFRLDWPGTILLVSFTTFILLAMETIGDPDKMHISVASVVIAFASAIALVFFESRSSDPLLGMRVLRNRSLSLALAAYFLVSLVYMGVYYLFPFYMQMELSLSVATTGMIMLLPSVMTLVMCIPIGRLCDRYGMKPFAMAACILTLIYSVALLFVTPDMGYMPLLLVEVVMGLVWSLCGSSSSGLIVASADEADKGMASGMVNFGSYLGCAAGPALYATLMSYGSGMPGVPIDILDSVSFMDGYWFAIVCSVGFSVLCIAATYLVKVRSA